ncbi:MAG: preprotein translocase subunit SecA [Nanoarchaeota archaeon]|nr:preprotein translocase subunit SecA [Nanoarchaeota archaeon]
MDVLESIDRNISEFEEILGMAFLRLFGSRNKRLLNYMQPTINNINGQERRSRLGRLVRKQRNLEEEVRSLSGEDMKDKTVEFRRQIAQAYSDQDLISYGNAEDLLRSENEEDRERGRRKIKAIKEKRKNINDTILDKILPEAYALVREAAKRTFEDGPRFGPHFDVQLQGGIVLHNGDIAEMKTGEGKTLVATLPAYLNALALNDKWIEKARERFGDDVSTWLFELIDDVPVNKGVHIVTVNEFLADRDCEWMSPVYNALGMSAGAIPMSTPGGDPVLERKEKRRAYNCDITYGKNSEFGFDYLRDSTQTSVEAQVQREFHFAIIDEVDSILIDEARTPHILSGGTEGHDAAEVKYAKQIADTFVGRPKRPDEKSDEFYDDSDVDFVYDLKYENPILTDRGRDKLKQILDDPDTKHFEHLVRNAIRAKEFFEEEKDYLVIDGEIVIIDEFTGRKAEGRRWTAGLHQALEAKHEGERKGKDDGLAKPVRIQEHDVTVASVTLQNYFFMYDKLAGMTGTAMTEAGEFDKTYGLDTIGIPPNKKLMRKEHSDQIYLTKAEKWEGVLQEVMDYHARGQPVLVGTRSVEDSELFSKMLEEHGLEHAVLNAKKHKEEAKIVEHAGELGQITVATNMAGRGTDIVLGEFEPEEILAYWKKYGLAPADLEINDPKIDDKLREFWKEKKIGAIGYGEITLAKYWRKKKMHDFRFDAFIYDWDAERGELTATKVAELGGLHIIGTEKHESRRIDNQLRGRSGRQGDPGSSRFIISIEDQLMARYAGKKMKAYLKRVGMGQGIPHESWIITKMIGNAQADIEGDHFKIRKNLLDYDRVMDEQRKAVYGIRQRILEKTDLREIILNSIIAPAIEDKIYEFTEENGSFNGNGKKGKTNFGKVEEWMKSTFGMYAPTKNLEVQGTEDSIQYLIEQTKETYAELEKRFGSKMQREVTARILRSVDYHWKYHIKVMDDLRAFIGYRGYAREDPKVAYAREGFMLFKEMMGRVRDDVLEDMSQDYFLAYDEAVGF